MVFLSLSSASYALRNSSFWILVKESISTWRMARRDSSYSLIWLLAVMIYWMYLRARLYFYSQLLIRKRYQSNIQLIQILGRQAKGGI